MSANHLIVTEFHSISFIIGVIILKVKDHSTGGMPLEIIVQNLQNYYTSINQTFIELIFKPMSRIKYLSNNVC